MERSPHSRSLVTLLSRLPLLSLLPRARCPSRGYLEEGGSRDPIGSCLSESREAAYRARLRGASQGQGEGQKSPLSAGVLIPLCSVQGEPSLILTLRSSSLRDRHRGQVSFPGGKWERWDADIVDTALRETHEELGLSLSRDCVWGTLRPLMDRTGMAVFPVLANLGPIDVTRLRPNPKEVEDVFTVSLRHVCTEGNRRYTHYRWPGTAVYTLPVFLNTNHKVWGLTAAIIENLLSFLFPDTYQQLKRYPRPQPI